MSSVLAKILLAEIKENEEKNCKICEVEHWSHKGKYCLITFSTATPVDYCWKKLNFNHLENVPFLETSKEGLFTLDTLGFPED